MVRGFERVNFWLVKGKFTGACSTTTESGAHLEQLDSHYSKHELQKASHQNYVIYGFYSNNDPSNYVLKINKLLVMLGWERWVNYEQFP